MPQNGYTDLIASDKCPIMTNGVAMSVRRPTKLSRRRSAAAPLAAKRVMDERGGGTMIAKERPGRWMPSKDWPGLHGHESGGVEIAAQTEGVFRFADGTIVLTDKAVKEIAALSEAAKAASKDRRESPARR
jgi:hypothetical protein